MVYVETSVISNLAARPSHSIIDLANQVATHDFWDRAKNSFLLFVSQLVIDEASRGDGDAASRRLDAIKELPILTIDERMFGLADKLLTETAVPRTNYDDAIHIATAAIHGVDFLLTWNCKHIANAVTRPVIYRACAGFSEPVPISQTPKQPLNPA